MDADVLIVILIRNWLEIAHPLHNLKVAETASEYRLELLKMFK
jgi:hypothetical protein